MKEYLRNLNEQQKEAVVNIGGYNLVIAGAGTGKTHTMISKVAYMIDYGIDPSQILMLTFTNKAADEMVERIIKYIGEEGTKVTACTFHSFFADFLRKYGYKQKSFDNKFSVLTSNDQEMLMKQVRKKWMDDNKPYIQEQNISKTNPFPSVALILRLHSESINNMLSYDDVLCEALQNSNFCYEDGGIGKYLNDAEAILKEFENRKKEYNVLDFDDMLQKSYEILRDDPEILKSLTDKYRYIICDEYQDTNVLQEELLKLISSRSGNLTVVGDDNQSIYAFRGAAIDNILTFEDRYPNCKTIKLVRNYRSTQEILNLSNNFMHHATEGIEKDLISDLKGLPPELRIFDSEKEIAQQIVQEIMSEYRNGKRFSDFAIIARNSNQLNDVEMFFERRRIPYVKYGGQKYLETKPVEDIVALFRIAANKKDAIAWQRVLSMYPGISGGYSFSIYSSMKENNTWYDELNDLRYLRYKFAEYLPELYKVISQIKSRSLSETLEYLCYDYYPGLRKRVLEVSSASDESKEKEEKVINALPEFLSSLVEMGKEYASISLFLDEVVLNNGTTEVEEQKDKVSLTTIHSAKGLEYDTVYVLGTIEGVFPRNNIKPREDSEELRCLYVACTRAKNTLKLYIPETHMEFGSGQGTIVDSMLSHHLAYYDVLDALEMDCETRMFSEKSIERKKFFKH